MAITRQQVQAAIQTLTEQGKPASIRAIRAYLGAGSLSTIQKHIQPQSAATPLWNADLSSLRQEVQELREEVKRLSDNALCNAVTHHAATPTETKLNINQANEIIRQGYLDKLTTAKIADRLNEAGILTSRGNPWTVDILGHYAKRQGLKP